MPTKSEKNFPATLVRFPASAAEERGVAFYLAAEECIARWYAAGSFLFSWQTKPTCVIGRHQIMHRELDVDFCRREGIDIVRRKSGGGAIFSDEGNVMWSFVAPGGAVEPIFAEYAQAVSGALRALGSDARATGRNDIVIGDGQKVCGNAFYHLAGRNIVHGTMLYDTNAARMQGALRPAPEKLQQRGVESVRRRVGLLKSQIPGGVAQMRADLERLLTTAEPLLLTEPQVSEIRAVAAGYAESAYLYGAGGRADIVLAERFPGVGGVEICLRLKGSLVEDVTLAGDYFETGEAGGAAECFCRVLAGLPATRSSLAEAAAQATGPTGVRGLSWQDVAGMAVRATAEDFVAPAGNSETRND
ncbi:MAG: lipoyltransferase [Prevotellaceae bacterium]|nr:lipoyltransferase [Prevotellaceae bacterium]